MGAVVRSNQFHDALLIRLDDPSGFPRLTRTLLEELRRQLDTLRGTPPARFAILTGTDKCFAAGAELSEVGELGAPEALHFSALGQRLMRSIEQSAKPVVAAIRGYCLGGGLDLALACHARVAASDAVFGHPGAALGIITGWGGTARLPRIVGRARAAEMLTTARTITAAEAYSWRLVSRVVPAEQLLTAAIDFCRHESNSRST